jgi:reactive chlorine resistance protein C
MSSTVMVRQPRLSSKPVAFGNAALRFGLAIVLFWIGGMKFTAYEAAGIQPLIATSPLMAWLYRIFSVRATSSLIGIAELTIAVLILLRPFSPRVALAGGIGGTAMFLTTLSFMLSLPGGVWAAGLGFPMLGEAGGFLIKDVVLLAASIAIATEAYSALVADR